MARLRAAAGNHTPRLLRRGEEAGRDLRQLHVGAPAPGPRADGTGPSPRCTWSSDPASVCRVNSIPPRASVGPKRAKSSSRTSLGRCHTSWNSATSRRRDALELEHLDARRRRGSRESSQGIEALARLEEHGDEGGGSLHGSAGAAAWARAQPHRESKRERHPPSAFPPAATDLPPPPGQHANPCQNTWKGGRTLPQRNVQFKAANRFRGVPSSPSRQVTRTPHTADPARRNIAGVSEAPSGMRRSE